MQYSGAGGKLIHQKNQKQKSRDTVPLSKACGPRKKLKTGRCAARSGFRSGPLAGVDVGQVLGGLVE